MYHGVIDTPLLLNNWGFLDVESFRWQIKYLKRNFDVIRLSDIEKRLSTNSKRPAAIITFDDGYKNNYDIAFPLLQDEGVPATIFLTTGKINTDDTISTSRLHNAFETSTKLSIEWLGDIFYLSQIKEKARLLKTIKEQLKQMPNDQMNHQVHSIISKLGGNSNLPLEKDSPFRMLSHKEIKIMLKSGLIDFGAHTHSHPILSKISYAKQKEEIERSIMEVEKLTGKPCEHFACPNGMEGDYNKATLEILESCKIKTAVTAIVGTNRASTSLLELKRYGPGAGVTKFSFLLNVHNFKAFVKESILGRILH